MMISEYKTARACVDKLQIIANTKALHLAVDGVAYTPTPTETYITEKLLTNDDSTVGIESTSSDIQRPIYQITLLAPKQQGKWALLNLVSDLKAEFSKASYLLRDGQQSVQVQSVSASPFTILETHGAIVVSVNLTTIATNT